MVENFDLPSIRIIKLIVLDDSFFIKYLDFIDLKQGMGESHTLDFVLELGYTKSAITQAKHHVDFLAIRYLNF